MMEKKTIETVTYIIASAALFGLLLLTGETTFAVIFVVAAIALGPFLIKNKMEEDEKKAAEVKLPYRIDHAHYEKEMDYECSACGARFSERISVCPECGAEFAYRVDDNEEYEEEEEDEEDYWDSVEGR